MRVRHFSLVFLASLAVMVSSTAFGAPIVVNGGFESQPSGVSFATYFTTANAVTGWVSGGNKLNTGIENLTSPDTGYGVTPFDGSFIALLGPDSTAAPGYGTLSQTITDNPGDLDSLIFYMASECFSGPSCSPNGPNGTSNSFTYGVGATTVTLPNVAETGTGTNGTYVKYTLNFNATGSDTIGFKFFNNDDYFALDDVSVAVIRAANPPTVPEPSSLLLLGTGVLGLAGAARRRLVKA